MKHPALAILLAAAALFATPAQALTDRSATVTGTAAVIAPASTNQKRQLLMLFNRSSDNIWCSWTGTATVAGAGSFGLLGTGANLIWAAPFTIPDDALSCISSGSSSGVTVVTIP